MIEYKWSKFKTIRIIDEKLRKVIVDICGDIINRSSTNEDMKSLKQHITVRDVLKLPEEEMKKYLLEFIKYFYYKEIRVPTAKDFRNNPKYPSSHTYQNVFGSWNNAIVAAGFQTNLGYRGGGKSLYTNEELLGYLIQFYEENGRSPTTEDFANNPRYPGKSIYWERFGGWQKALILIGLDIDSMVRRGVIDTNQQKARLGELFVLDHFEEIGVVDLSGKNCTSFCDGICPKGYNYDVKVSYFNISYWYFNLKNKNIDRIEWFYLLAFNEGFTELLYVWRIPARNIIDDIRNGYMYINKKRIENMKEYLITERIKPMFENWLDNIKVQDNSKEAIVQDANIILRRYVENKG